jgi:hypothetical protein
LNFDNRAPHVLWLLSSGTCPYASKTPSSTAHGLLHHHPYGDSFRSRVEEESSVAGRNLEKSFFEIYRPLITILLDIILELGS